MDLDGNKIVLQQYLMTRGILNLPRNISVNNTGKIVSISGEA